jgi:hypothetical protein
VSRPDIRRTTRQARGAGGGGIACPACGERIAISLDDILVRHAFRCQTAGCGLVLRLDQRGSAEALDTLRELRTRLREIGGDAG